MRPSPTAAGTEKSLALQGPDVPKGVITMTKALVKIQNRAAATLRKEDGATAVEYGLMVALIAVVIIVAVLALGNKLSSLFTDVSGQI